MNPFILVFALIGVACAVLPVPDRWRKGTTPSLPVATPTLPAPTPSPTASPSPTPQPTPFFDAPKTVRVGEAFKIELFGVRYHMGLVLMADDKWTMGLFGVNPAKRPALYSVILRNAGNRKLSVLTEEGELSHYIQVLP